MGSEVVELDAEHSTIHFHVQPEKQSWLHVDETEPPEVPDMGGVRPDGAACCARKCSKCPKLGGQRRLLPAPEPRKRIQDLGITRRLAAIPLPIVSDVPELQSSHKAPA